MNKLECTWRDAGHDALQELEARAAALPQHDPSLGQTRHCRPVSTPPVIAEGRKDDGGKDPWHLLPWDAVRAIVRVLAFGANKYAPRNWEKGMAWSRPYAGLMRHMTAWWEGERYDPETGYSHLTHAGCCIVFLIAYELRGKGHDDRPREIKHGPARIDQTSRT